MVHAPHDRTATRQQRSNVTRIADSQEDAVTPEHRPFLEALADCLIRWAQLDPGFRKLRRPLEGGPEPR